MIDIVVKNNSNIVLADLEKACKRGLTAIGMASESFAKKDPNMPVDTGLARNSITFALNGERANIDSYKADRGDKMGTYNGVAPSDGETSVYIGSNVEYFVYIELGGKNMNARHVLQNAASHKEEFKKLMENSIKNA